MGRLMGRVSLKTQSARLELLLLCGTRALYGGILCLRGWWMAFRNFAHDTFCKSWFSFVVLVTETEGV